MDYDYALVGGGLQNGLVALALRARQPHARIAMLERGDAPGGNHTWCFHAGDVGGEARAWIDPMIVARWSSYDVAFPSVKREVMSAYAMVTSERFASLVRAALEAPGSRLLTGVTVTGVGATQVTWRDARGDVRTLTATAVIDARGPDRSPDGECGYQKFVGQEVELAEPHGLTRPMLMDATVPQLDGFRFFYVLPLAPDRLLVEDTYFSDKPYLDVAALRAAIAAHCTERGWRVTNTIREETGVLPLPWRMDAVAPGAPLVAGYAGGWFHPVTGYSFPLAARLAAAIASVPAHELYRGALDSLAAQHSGQLRFAARLVHMLFHWFAPADRYHVLERFYRVLPASTIERFYALELTGLDRMRFFVGPPPRGLSLRGVLGMEAS